jgi:branched-chain amino acid transport system substrate-binding protein
MQSAIKPLLLALLIGAAAGNAQASGMDIPITQGVLHYTPEDHFGLEEKARVMLTIQNGTWKAVPP